MRNVEKMTPPQVLVENREAWNEALSRTQSDHNKTRYRHPDIKKRLMEESNNKCVYCESKLGHNCPADIEHKIPKSRRPDLIFDWDNMTIACTECNRRKLDYYEPSCMFLDPNQDDVENMVLHFGPVVLSVPGNTRSELTLRILELDRNVLQKRSQLLGRKLEKLEQIRNFVERIIRTKNSTLKQFMIAELHEYCSISAEFSGMVKTYVEALPSNWSTNMTRTGRKT